MKRLVFSLIIILMFSGILSAQEQPPSKLYPFALEFDPQRNVLLSFQQPPGYDRFPINRMTQYMAWLTNLPLKHKNHPLIRYDNQIITRADSIGAVIDLGITSKNQLGADMPIQLAMEYLAMVGKLNSFYFIVEKGDSLSFDSWLGGKYKRDARGNLLYEKTEKRQPSMDEYYRFLEFVISRNSANSLINNLDKIKDGALAPGDIYIAAETDGAATSGFVAVILDICSNKDGDLVILPAWGGYPAQSLHIPFVSGENKSSWFTIDQFKEKVVAHGKGSFYRYMRLINL